MGKYRLSYMDGALFLFLFACFPLWAHASDLPQRMTLMSHVWAPYQVLEDSKIGGLTGRISRCALDKTGIPYTVDVVPVSRAQESVKHGTADGWFVARETNKRNLFAVRTGEYVASVKVAVVTLRDSEFDPADPSFIRTKGIATVRGTGSYDQLSELNPNAIKARTEEQMVDLLRNGRVDGIFYTLLPVDYLLKSYAIPFKYHIFKETHNYLYFGKEFAQRYKGIIPLLDKYLPLCRDEMSKN